MEAKDYLHYISDVIHRTIVATVDDEGLPVTAAIDMMDSDENGLYFLTAKGKGFYDRFYAGIKGQKPFLLGVCYDFQISSEIPVEDHDIAADVIVAVPTAEDNDEEEE